MAPKKAGKAGDKQKTLQSMQLKNISMDEATMMHTAFTVLDEDEDGILFYEDAKCWIRAIGWVWSDAQCEDNLRSGANTGKDKFTVTELLKIADNNYAEKFVLAGDGPKVFETFNVFDFDQGGTLMRADLQKYLEKECTPAQFQQTLETLGYPPSALTLKVDELSEKMSKQLDEPNGTDFAANLAGVAN